MISLGVTLAFTTRLITNVVTRPEFVGWFNHSTYYWVQTRALLQDGKLAYEDMPLLFGLYAALAKVIHWVGVSFEDGIVLASRLVMVVTPALIPIAIYSVARRANKARCIGWETWCLIIASGFLPLTYANMPETLQKNMMGLFLHSLAFVAIFRWLAGGQASRLIVALLLVVVIALVHLGSAMAALLLVAAVAFELACSLWPHKKSVRPMSIAAAISVLILIVINVLYPSAEDRFRALLDVFYPEDTLEAIAVSVGTIVWIFALRYLRRWLARQSSDKDPVVSSLMRIAVLWTGLLVFPLWPGEIGMRLLLFIPLALVVVLILLLSQVRYSRWLRIVSAATALVFCLMSIGEAVSNHMIYPNKDEISADLVRAKKDYQLTKDDMVITPYGVNPTANWFLGTKASLVTAVTQNVFADSARVFVLNTLERPAPQIGSGKCKIIETENDRYWTTRHDVPLTNAVANPDLQTFAFFQLASPPTDWSFDDNGIWNGWGDCGGYQ